MGPCCCWRTCCCPTVYLPDFLLSTHVCTRLYPTTDTGPNITDNPISDIKKTVGYPALKHTTAQSWRVKGKTSSKKAKKFLTCEPDIRGDMGINYRCATFFIKNKFRVLFKKLRRIMVVNLKLFCLSAINDG
jgi:hypothetical protein